ncbi:MAG: leishmanolysin-related zinc metalloendopeptidase [Planctomycetota bacterium]
MAISYERLNRVRTMSLAASRRARPEKNGRKKRSKTRREQNVAGNCEDDDFVSPFQIDVRFNGGITDAQKEAFDVAAARWSQVIVSEFAPVELPNGEVLDNLLIEASGEDIDGTGGILGSAGPQFLRPGSMLPVKGIMRFDSADLANMEANGSLVDVIIHEMGHVLGIGTIWGIKELLVGCDAPMSANPVFLGEKAITEFAALTEEGSDLPVPVANTGGSGTRCGHWRESIFGAELMTGFINTGTNPLSRLTIASLEDLGYDVNYHAADPYSIPTQFEMMMMGVGSDCSSQTCGMCNGSRKKIVPVILSEDSLVH